MTAPHDIPRSPAQSQHALRVLELFSTAAGISFDRMLAARTFGEAERAVPGEDCYGWSRRLVEVGESLNLRIRCVECSLDEALAFVRQDVPVALCVGERESELRWHLIAETSGRRVRLVAENSGEADRWTATGKLPAAIGLESRSATARWVIGQPALVCEPPLPEAGNGTPTHTTPFARLFDLLRPEKKDLWVVLVFSLFAGLLALAAPIAVEALVNTVAFGRYLQPIIVLAILLFTFLAFAAAMLALLTYVAEILQRRLLVRVVEDLAYRLPRVQQQAFDKDHGPELVNRFFDVVTVQKAAGGLLLDGTALVLQTIIGMTVLAFYHPFFLGFNVVLLAVLAFIVFGLGRGAITTAVKESKAKYAVAAWLEELARHPTAFKLHAGPQLALDRADQLAVDWLDARRASFRIVIRQILFSVGLQAVAATVILGLGGWLVIQNQLTLGQLVAAELIVMVIVRSFTKLGKHLEDFYKLLASVDKLGYLFDLPIEPHDKLFHLRDGAPASIHVCGVSYSHAADAALSDLNLRIEPGESLALTGPAASGKSTLVDLLCGMRLPSAGHIELDGIDLRELRPDSLREHLAMARGVEIFHGSIGENVQLNRAGLSAMDVRDALDTVGLLDEVMKLPEGLNTVLQTNGSPLSHSQALRLMLARATAGRPRLLLVDGTLDALSDDTLAGVLANLTGSQARWTLLVATGRSDVIAACDRVIQLDRDEQANKEDLAKNNDGNL